MVENNDISLKFLGEISQDFVKVSDFLKEAAYQVVSRKFSEYPIFPISKSKVPVGEPLYQREDLNLDWNYNIIYLEAFVETGLIDPNKVEHFKNNYKDHQEFCCLFIVDERWCNFLYIPYPED